MLTIIEELMHSASTVGDDQLRRAERKLDKLQPHERVLGTIHSRELRQVWTFIEQLMKQADLAQHIETFDADEQTQIDDAQHQCVRWQALARLAREAFWIQAREDIGGSAWDRGAKVGLREGWQLVARMGHGATGRANIAGLMQQLGGLFSGGGIVGIGPMPGEEGPEDDE